MKKPQRLTYFFLLCANTLRASAAVTAYTTGVIHPLLQSAVRVPTDAFLYLQVANAVRTSAAAANIIGTEQPCRVRLRLWHCSAADPTAALEVPSLTIPDAVLCSEMGVHFSACGRYLAACVACQVNYF